MNVVVPRFSYLIIFGLFALTCCSNKQSYEFDIGAGDSGIALRQFALQANIEIIFNSGDLEGISTNSVRGKMHPNVALDKMLKNTGLHYKKESQSNVYAIVRK